MFEFGAFFLQKKKIYPEQMALNYNPKVKKIPRFFGCRDATFSSKKIEDIEVQFFLKMFQISTNISNVKRYSQPFKPTVLEKWCPISGLIDALG